MVCNWYRNWYGIGNYRNYSPRKSRLPEVYPPDLRSRAQTRFCPVFGGLATWPVSPYSYLFRNTPPTKNLVVTSLVVTSEPGGDEPGDEPGGGEPAAKRLLVPNALACYNVITTPIFIW